MARRILGRDAVDFRDADGRALLARDAVDFRDGPDSLAVELQGHVRLGPVRVSGRLAHGPSLSGRVRIGPVVVSGVLDHASHAIDISGRVVLGPVVVLGRLSHGISGSGRVALRGPIVRGGLAHGVGMGGRIILGPIHVQGEMLHPRHILKGRVRIGSVLVNRFVRAHRLDTGAVVGEGETVGGRFELSVGWEPRAHYVVALDRSESAEDWVPPIQNHLMSELAVD